MQRQTTISKPTLVVAGIALVATAISFFVYKPSQNQQSSQDANTSQTQPAPTTQTEQASAEDTELRPQSPSERAQVSKPPPITQPISRPAAPVAAQAPAIAGPEPSA